MHTLLIMIDGLGMAQCAVGDSIYGTCPTLIELMTKYSQPIDACLGTAGLPQSATGQTALFTGVNAAEVAGGHLPGFPNATLRKIIERENIFSRLLQQGKTCTFANAYARHTEASLPLSLRSVTTVATLAAFGQVRNRDELLAGNAVYHDLTREWLRAHGDRDVPIVSETTAAGHLLAIMHSVDFCLFEYFLTDHVAHRGTTEEKNRVLSSLDRFLASLMTGMDLRNDLLLITSDHGNIEDTSRRGHTRNPVPWITFGRDAELHRRTVRSILDVTPFVLSL